MRGIAQRICRVKHIVMHVEGQEPQLSENCRAREAWGPGEFTVAKIVRRAGGGLDGIPITSPYLGPLGFLVCLKKARMEFVLDVDPLKMKGYVRA